MTRTLGIIGSGQVGATLATSAVTAGWDVVLANSRGPRSLEGLVAGLGERARAATPREAAAEGDLVVVAVPLAALDDLPREALAGKVVIDAMNYVPDRDGRIAALDSDELTSSELVQRRLTGSSVVKAFNNITPRHLLALARPTGAADRSALPITGDDTAAKEEAATVIDALGYDTVDVGPLAQSWRFGPSTALYAVAYGGQEVPAGLSGTELLAWFSGLPGAPLPAHQVERLAADTVRAPAGVSFGG